MTSGAEPRVRGVAPVVGAGFIVLLAIANASCHSIGAATLGRDHFDYNEAISASWKEQLLLNMVRLRYGDAPVFLDVVSVIAQYQVGAQVSANAPSADRPSTVSAGSAAAVYADKPTITYSPRTGTQLAKTLLTPIPLPSLFSLVQAGWPVDLTFATTVRSINGIPAHEHGASSAWNPAFHRAVAAIARVSDLGAASARKDGDRTLYAFQTEGLSDEARAALAELRAALDLDPAVDEYEIVASRLPASKRQIAIGTSTIIEVLSLLASQFEVPEEHIKEGWTYASLRPAFPTSDRPVIVVHAGSSAPAHVFAATRERGSWFWIDESDYGSKRAFSFLVMLLALIESGGAVSPVVTIGAG